MPKANSSVICTDIIDQNDLWCHPEFGRICGVLISRRADLPRHRDIHAGKWKYQCEYPNCGQKFRQGNQLAIHNNTHTGEKPYKCDKCMESFGDPSSRCRHRKEQHECQFICFVNGCGKAISRKSNFQKHLQGHMVYVEGLNLEQFLERCEPSLAELKRKARKAANARKKGVATRKKGANTKKGLNIKRKHSEWRSGMANYVEPARSETLQIEYSSSYNTPPYSDDWSSIILEYCSQLCAAQTHEVQGCMPQDDILFSNPTSPLSLPVEPPPSISSSFYSSPDSTFDHITEPYPHYTSACQQYLQPKQDSGNHGDIVSNHHLYSSMGIELAPRGYEDEACFETAPSSIISIAEFQAENPYPTYG